MCLRCLLLFSWGSIVSTLIPFKHVLGQLQFVTVAFDARFGLRRCHVCLFVHLLQVVVDSLKLLHEEGVKVSLFADLSHAVVLRLVKVAIDVEELLFGLGLHVFLLGITFPSWLGNMSLRQVFRVRKF